MDKKKLKQPKVIKKIGNKVILEPYDPKNNVNQKRKAVYTDSVRKVLSEKRRSRIKQPRSGQSTKPDDMFSQLLYEYFGCSKKITKPEELEKLISDVNLGEYKKRSKTKTTKEEKKVLINWLIKNKDYLTTENPEDLLTQSGIIASYHIQHANFRERKIPNVLFENDAFVPNQSNETDNSDLEFINVDTNYFPEDILIAKSDLKQSFVNLTPNEISVELEDKLLEIYKRYLEYFNNGILDYSFTSEIEEVVKGDIV